SQRRCARASTRRRSMRSAEPRRPRPKAGRTARARWTRARRTGPRSNRGSEMPPGTKIFDFGWVAGHLGQVWERIVQHLQLTVIPLALGIVIALVLAVIALRRPVIYGPVTAVAGILYTIPSLAAFALLLPIFGLSLLTAVIPLTTYTLLILFRNFTAGFNAVPAEILEA